MRSYGQLAWRPSGKDGTAIVVGVIESPAVATPGNEHPKDELMLTFSGQGGIAGFGGQIVNVAAVPKHERGSIEWADINHAFLCKIWNTASGTHDVIQLLMRKSTAEADREGYDQFFVAGMVQTTGPLPDLEHGWLDLDLDEKGGIRVTASDRDPEMLNVWTGSSHGQILKEPVWGWADEPWALSSTMRERPQRDCQELQGLLLRTEIMGETLGEAEAARMADLMATEARRAINIHPNMDKDYRMFLEMKVEQEGVGSMIGFLGKETLSEVETHRQSVQDMVSRIMQMDDGFNP